MAAVRLTRGLRDRRLHCGKAALGVFTAGVLAGGAGAAGAATVEVVPSPDAWRVGDLVFRAAPGEANRVALTGMTDGVTQWWAVTDTGAMLVPGNGCRRVDEHTAECGSTANDHAVVVLGDLNDTLTVSGPRVSGFYPPSVVGDGGDGHDALTAASYHGNTDFRGGPGDDLLTAAGFGGSAISGGRQALDGGPGDDRLVGGAGEDRLRGGGGRDELHGGDGFDWLTDGDRDGADGDAAPGPDVLDGGADGDTVSYAERTAGVVVNLADGKPDGEPGEGDVLSSVESVVGGRGDDRLTGNRDGNQIDGGGGRNELRGNGGEDTFSRARGRIFCGSGDIDLVNSASWRDFPQPDCERISPADDVVGAPAPYPGWKRGQPVFRVSCIYDPEGDPAPCSVSVRVREASSGHRLLARGALRRGDWRNHRLTARLTSRGRLAASRRHGRRAVVRLDEPGRPPLRWTIRLRVRR